MSAIEPESDLIRQAVGGDLAALAQLLLLHYDGLYRHVDARITRELQGLMRAEDVLQQTFVRAAQAITAFEMRHENAFWGWLLAIADNLMRDAHKRRQRERRAEPETDSGLLPRVSRLAGSQSSPSRRVARGEMFEHLKAALARLPAEQREILRRRYFQCQSLEEIAAETGRTKDGVRGLCFRARKSLRAAMGHTSLYFSD